MATTPSCLATPERTRFATADPDEAQEFIRRMYTARPGKATAFDRRSAVALSQISVRGLSFVDLTLPPDLTLSLEGTDDLSVSTLVTGKTHAELGKDVERYRPGDVCLGSFPRGDYLVACHELHVQIMTVPAAAMAGVAAAQPRFGSLAPRSAAAAGHWRRAAAFVRGLLDDDATASSPLLIGHATRLLAATALTVFPNTAYPGDGPAGTTAPDTLRRAEDFVHEHAHTDIGLGDIARACHVTPRALQYAFARHHDLTPLEYLRRIRLARAHDDLVAADPGRGDTVTAIAIRWGFPHPGRFAVAYKREYGRPPSHTLRG
ncbi:helix-turn-helix domain-containing protein [Amycolatopsis lexingtonensis]|uniref:helix-turn-helix domain-containing protein n=1 Tax=Amycolatopsis lexingtonensis TaxID=218822 RepID=UPI003F7082F1